MNQNQPPLSRKVTRRWLGDSAIEGVPSEETSELIGIMGNELVRLNEVTTPTCVGCGRALPLVARCCVCLGLMCGGESCGAVLCANERCRRACCPACRERVTPENEPPQYLCQPHYDDVLRERAIIGLVALLVVGLALLQLMPK